VPAGIDHVIVGGARETLGKRNSTDGAMNGFEGGDRFFQWPYAFLRDQIAMAGYFHKMAVEVSALLLQYRGVACGIGTQPIQSNEDAVFKR